MEGVGRGGFPMLLGGRADHEAVGSDGPGRAGNPG